LYPWTNDYISLHLFVYKNIPPNPLFKIIIIIIRKIDEKKPPTNKQISPHAPKTKKKTKKNKKQKEKNKTNQINK
jgi:hypothetical protein